MAILIKMRWSLFSPEFSFVRFVKYFGSWNCFVRGKGIFENDLRDLYLYILRIFVKCDEAMNLWNFFGGDSNSKKYFRKIFRIIYNNVDSNDTLTLDAFLKID